MKKMLLYGSASLIVLICLYGEWRSFYCIAGNRCVTVWKTFNNKCYIIPGKYYGFVKPSTNVLVSSNTNSITLFFSDELPSSWIYKSEEELEVENRDTKEITFYDYKSDERKFDSLLYSATAVKHKDVKPNVQYLDLYILDDIASDKNGRLDK